jgi:hypothetical protein
VGHIARAFSGRDRICFALGVEVMKEMGMEIKTVRAGHANMFLVMCSCSVFTNTMAAILN